MSQTKQASVEEIWNSNSKTFDSGYHNTHIDYMDKETFIKLLREYSQSKDREIEELKDSLTYANKALKISLESASNILTAKEAEVEKYGNESMIFEMENRNLQAELNYWRERCSEIFNVLKVIFYSTVKTEENPIAEWEKFLERNNYKELYDLLNSDMQSNGASQEKSNSSTSDDTIKKLKEVLEDCEDYFESRADADHNGEGVVPNKEMVLLSEIRKCLKK